MAETFESRATCSSPSVRKEWRSFTDQQKTEWLSAVKCLNKLPHDPKLFSLLPPPGQPFLNTSASLYDDLSYVHIDLYPIIHFVGIFLPWHRWFLNLFEQKMRGKCGYTGPMGYWDWSLDAADPEHSSMFDPNPQSGLGSLGTAENNYYLKDGALADFIVAYPKPHILQRDFSVTPFAEKPARLQPTPWLVTKPNTDARDVLKPENVDALINGYKGDFLGFYTKLDEIEGFHTTVHLMVGGDMQDAAHSSNDPMFYLHHGQLDRLWALWQKADPANARAFGGGSVPAILSADLHKKFPAGSPPNVNLDTVMPNDNYGDRSKVKDVIDTQGGYLCYVYE
jgi:tyrosinase